MNSMNIIEFAESLQAKMKQELDTLNTNQDEIVKIGKRLSFIRELIKELKAFTQKYKFQNQTEEIHFFKEMKPVFISQYFYYKKVFTIRVFDSFRDVKSRQANYYRMLQQLEAYIEKNLEFHQYCISGETFLDAHYFTRNSKNHKPLDWDESFSTGYDTKVAKIIANELLRKFILELLQISQSEGLNGASQSLTWTGSKTDLIELIYCLQYAETFNNGATDIKLIASTFESLFNVNLGDYYRTFLNIRLRKSNTTSFIDSLKEKLRNRLKEFNEA
jgi:hypothetical protein